MDWGQTLLTALLVALVAAVATLWAARRSAGAVERAAERGARGAVEAAALTSTATRDAAELARSALIEKDVREDRRPRVRALQKRAAEREAIYKQAIGRVWSEPWDYEGLGDYSRRLSAEFPLQAGDQYVGIDDETFHTAVEEYWRADLRSSGALWGLSAMRFLEDFNGRFKESILDAAELASADQEVSRRRAEEKDDYQRRFDELHAAVTQLHEAAERYVRGN